MITLAACSTTGGTHAFTPQAVDSDEAAIYFYRPAAMANAIYSPDLNVNDEFKLSIKNGQVSRLVLPPGETTIEIAADEHYSDVNRLALNLIAGTTYFIRVDTALKIENTTVYEPYFRSFSLVSVADEAAAREIAECCADKSMKTKDTAESVSKILKTDDSFSVDKTQNPFSH
jgi:hypothetical protein